MRAATRVAGLRRRRLRAAVPNPRRSGSARGIRGSVLPVMEGGESAPYAPGGRRRGNNRPSLVSSAQSQSAVRWHCATRRSNAGRLCKINPRILQAAPLKLFAYRPREVSYAA